MTAKEILDQREHEYDFFVESKPEHSTLLIKEGYIIECMKQYAKLKCKEVFNNIPDKIDIALYAKEHCRTSTNYENEFMVQINAINWILEKLELPKFE